VSSRFAGAPEPEIAAAIVACIEAVLGHVEPREPAGIPVWRREGIRENVTPPPTPGRGVSWRAAIAGR
jgi:hypothetical protein